MTIASLQFLGFVLAVAAAYNLARPLWWRQSVLLVANLGFLVTFAPDWIAFLPLLGFLTVGYACVRFAQRGLGAAAYGVAVGGIILLFFWLKRYSFIPSETFLPFAYSVIGLSYIFFRVLHLVLDAHGGDLDEPVPVIGYVNYVLNFASLVSGPIQRYQDFAASQGTADRPPLDIADIGNAIERIATGFFKVIVLAAILNAVHANALLSFAAASTREAAAVYALATTAGYTFYLYCNFAGYTDIVIGAARLYRLTLPENFNYPFFATNFIDFWGRWHMTLSEWLKTYVYNPMTIAMMERLPSSATTWIGVASFFVTFFLIGLWHGQTSVFAAYGVALGLGVSVNKLYQVELTKRLGRKRYRALGETLWYQALCRGLTFTWFNASLVLFWGNWKVIGDLVSGLGATGILLACAALIVASGLGLTAAALARDLALRPKASDGTPLLASRYCRTVSATAIAAIALACLTLLAAPAPDIVYKTF
jgi:D-alanyl-lipoteichoic acid acyltransferase DltB (MBOAT superfamily)